MPEFRGHAVAKVGDYIIVSGVAKHADEGGFVSTCPELDIASQGESVEEAFENLGDAIPEFVSALLDAGELDGYLSSHGVVFTISSR